MILDHPFRLWYRSQDRELRFNGFVTNNDTFEGEAYSNVLNRGIWIKTVLPPSTYHTLVSLFEKLPEVESQVDNWAYRADLASPSGKLIKVLNRNDEKYSLLVKFVDDISSVVHRVVECQFEALSVSTEDCVKRWWPNDPPF